MPEQSQASIIAATSFVTTPLAPPQEAGEDGSALQGTMGSHAKAHPTSHKLHRLHVTRASEEVCTQAAPSP